MNLSSLRQATSCSSILSTFISDETEEVALLSLQRVANLSVQMFATTVLKAAIKDFYVSFIASVLLANMNKGTGD
jgi:hypothetical protein